MRALWCFQFALSSIKCALGVTQHLTSVTPSGNDQNKNTLSTYVDTSDSDDRIERADAGALQLLIAAFRAGWIARSLATVQQVRGLLRTSTSTRAYRLVHVTHL
jgi:hypothetical protein